MKNDTFDNTPQGAREQDYLTSGVFKKKTDARNLHMFFSPYMVPAGLSDDEVKLCLELHDRRKKISEHLTKKKKEEIRIKLLKRFEEDYFLLEKEREVLSITFGEHAFDMIAEEIAALRSEMEVIMHYPIPLPDTLLKSPMTRECFAAGVKTLINSMDMLDC